MSKKNILILVSAIIIVIIAVIFFVWSLNLDKNIEIPIYDWIGLRRNGFTWDRIFKYKITK